MSAAASAAVAAAIAQAVKASGTIVSLEPDAFESLLARVPQPLVVYAEYRTFRTWHRYLFSYRGLAFYAESREPLSLPDGAEVIRAKKIWIPG